VLAAVFARWRSRPAPRSPLAAAIPAPAGTRALTVVAPFRETTTEERSKGLATNAPGRVTFAERALHRLGEVVPG
jgi:hypothetical protein